MRIAHSAHLTLTPVIEHRIGEFTRALAAAADEVRGTPAADPWLLLATLRLLGYGPGGRVPGPTAAWRLLRLAGAGSVSADRPMATLMALLERLPRPVAEALLIELLARMSEPR